MMQEIASKTIWLKWINALTYILRITHFSGKERIFAEPSLLMAKDVFSFIGLQLIQSCWNTKVQVEMIRIVGSVVDEGSLAVPMIMNITKKLNAVSRITVEDSMLVSYIVLVIFIQHCDFPREDMIWLNSLGLSAMLFSCDIRKITLKNTIVTIDMYEIFTLCGYVIGAAILTYELRKTIQSIHIIFLGHRYFHLLFLNVHVMYYICWWLDDKKMHVELE